MERINFVGFSEEELPLVRKDISDFAEKEIQAAPESMEKSDEDLRQFTLSIEAVNDELKSLELTPNFKLDSSHVILLKDAGYRKLLESHGLKVDPVAMPGLREVPANLIYLAADDLNGDYRWRILMHEIIHAASNTSYVNDDGDPMLKKTGYHLWANDGSKFALLNELVTEKITEELMLKICPNPNYCDPVMNESHAIFDEDIILNGLIENISKIKNLTTDEVWLLFKKSYFTGDLRHLGDVESAFGRGSLKELANSGSSIIDDIEEYHRDHEKTSARFGKASD